jgi:hypothetical protein
VAQEETFICDECGNEFPISKMKEVFKEGGDKERLCPEDLDKQMNKADRVKGGPGEEKTAAAYVDEKAEEAPYGERG